MSDPTEFPHIVSMNVAEEILHLREENEQLRASYAARNEGNNRLFRELQDEKERLLNALENLVIAVGMGWDLDGVMRQAEEALPVKDGRRKERAWTGPGHLEETRWTKSEP